MKASELEKQSETIESIYKQIKQANDNKWCKCFIPHWIYVSDDIRLKLMSDGFKVYQGIWVSEPGLIIEW